MGYLHWTDGDGTKKTFHQDLKPFDVLFNADWLRTIVPPRTKTVPMNDVPASFLEALAELAGAFRLYRETVGHDAVLVGGAATVLYTAGAFSSGDFDFVVIDDQVFGNVMAKCGFIKETRSGRLHIGYYHPQHPEYGFQAVSGALFDGRADRRRLVAVSVREGRHITLPAVEDIIADRLAQHSVAPPNDSSRLEQARLMFLLAAKIDMEYLRKRVEEEGGDISLLLPRSDYAAP